MAEELPRSASTLQTDKAAMALSREISAENLRIAVLVVEDEVLIGMLVASLLEDIGFESVTIVADSAQALHASSEKDFGLVVSDIILENSRLNGIDIVASILRRRAVPVVFITAHAGVDDLQRIAIETPRAAVLRKPVVGRELQNAIAALTETWLPN